MDYLNKKQIKSGLLALKKYNSTREERGKKDLLGEEPRVLLEIVFKNIPANSKTYIHLVRLPHHWRTESEDYELAILVPHRKAENEAQAMQFAKDRDLDVDNTHDYYKQLFEERLDESLRSRISRIITTKELATEYNTFQKMDRLSKSFDLFLSEKKLMSNKMNSVPRRLGRRFWLREKKVPLMIKLEAKNLNERFQRVLSTEPFYVTGRTSTERIQIGLMDQKVDQLVENIHVFLKKLKSTYGNGVRFIKFRCDKGLSLPVFADLSLDCPDIVKRRKRTPPVVDEFDFYDEDGVKVAVRPSGSVKVIMPRSGDSDNKMASKRKAQESSSPSSEKAKKKKVKK